MLLQPGIANHTESFSQERFLHNVSRAGRIRQQYRISERSIWRRIKKLGIAVLNKQEVI